MNHISLVLPNGFSWQNKVKVLLLIRFLTAFGLAINV